MRGVSRFGLGRLVGLAALLGAVVSVVLAFGAGSALAAGSWTCTDSSADQLGLQGAINPGGTVSVYGPLPCLGNWSVGNDTTIQGFSGAVLNGNATGSVLKAIGNPITLTLRNLKVTNGLVAPVGGGINMECCGNTLNLSNVVVTQNTAADAGGGIFIDNGTINDPASTVSNNAAVEGGGIFAVDGSTVNVTNSSVTGNTASEAGGGILAESDVFLNLTGATVSRNTAGSAGGGIFAVDVVFLNATASTIASNTAGSAAIAEGDPLDSAGGGILAELAFVTLTSTRVSWNTDSGSGGGIWFMDGDFNPNGLRPSGGAQPRRQGHFPQLSLPSVPGLKPVSGVSPFDPPIGMAPGLNLFNSTVDHNTATFAAGGGIANQACEENSPVTLSNSTVAFNQATGSDLDTDSGGGGYAQYGGSCGDGSMTASLVATNSSFGGNLAKSSVGGAIFNVNFGITGSALVTLAQSPTSRLPFNLNNNQALYGGGIFNYGDGANTTLQPGAHVVSNHASVTGGGVYNDCNSTLTIAPGVVFLFNLPNNVFNNGSSCLLGD